MPDSEVVSTVWIMFATYVQHRRTDMRLIGPSGNLFQPSQCPVQQAYKYKVISVKKELSLLVHRRLMMNDDLLHGHI